jgi:DMSO/TMAO reductase YedYZ molybdopterin-dependent catalytic subunit
MVSSKLLLLILLVAVITASGCIQSGPIKLNGTEVREYQGEDLSSINDFRENSIKGPQYINIDSYSLSVTGLVENDQTYTYDDVLTNFNTYEKLVTLYCVEGWSVKLLWEGVLLRDIIDSSTPLQEANTVIFHAYDGYTSSLPLDYIFQNDILLAYKMNDVTLPPERGYPFQVVAEDKWGYKWVKWVTKIELSNNEDYEGFWESRGYSNSGDLDKAYFG